MAEGGNLRPENEDIQKAKVENFESAFARFGLRREMCGVYGGERVDPAIYDGLVSLI
jgi:hypothetical protein